MKLLYRLTGVLILVGILSSCGYRKVKEVRVNSVTGEVQYVIWVEKGTIVLDGFRVPINEATCEKIDSLDKEADKLIQKAKNAENCD